MPKTVTRPSTAKPNSEMSLIGYIVAAGVFLLLLPVLPFLAVLWLLDRIRSDQSDVGPDRP